MHERESLSAPVTCSQAFFRLEGMQPCGYDGVPAGP